METFKINEIEYECEFILENADDQKIEFTKSAIRGMTTISSIFDPFEDGTISIANPYDFVENDYLIRGDGRDKFKVMFKAKDKPEKEKYERTFYIFDESNSGLPDSRSENIKTFSIIDENKLPFLEEVPFGITFSGKVGDILKDIFKQLIGEESVDEDNWESGDFDITYIPPVNWRYIDVMNEMLKLFYAKDGEIHVKALLNYDREKEKYSFKLISDIFKNNKDNLLEAFSLGDLVDKFETDNENNPPPDAEVMEYLSTKKNLSYTTPNQSITNNLFTNRIVHSYDPILGELKMRKINIKDFKDKWKEKFVDVFSAIGGKPKPFIVRNSKDEKKFRHFRFPYTIDQNAGIVEGELSNALIFYNLQCYFSNIGDTRRDAGKFVDIYKPKKQKLKSDEKILGRWLITEIRHVFFADLYINEFYCTKTYVGPTSKIKEDAE